MRMPVIAAARVAEVVRGAKPLMIGFLCKKTVIYEYFAWVVDTTGDLSGNYASRAGSPSAQFTRSAGQEPNCAGQEPKCAGQEPKCPEAMDGDREGPARL
jgi:hypothetical protein